MCYDPPQIRRTETVSFSGLDFAAWGEQMCRLAAIWLALVPIALQFPSRAVAQIYPLESNNVSGNSTGAFHLELINGRWWIIAPDGNGDFIRSVSIFDTTNGTDWYGGFRSYDRLLA